MSSSACSKAVRKMIGVCSEALRWRSRAAVSKPSMSAIRTSSRISAKSCLSSIRSASRPELAVTTFWCRGARIDSMATSLAGVSSTIRMLALGSGGIFAVLAFRFLLGKPGTEQRQQLLGVHRLGDVVGGAGLQALLAVALHGLRGQRDDGQVLQAVDAADRGHRLVAVHAR